MVKRKTTAKVFIVSGRETQSGRPTVHFGRTPSQINRNGKSFKNIALARKFANTKAKKLGKRTFETLVSSGIKTTKVK